jgi:hypothetical protein
MVVLVYDFSNRGALSVKLVPLICKMVPKISASYTGPPQNFSNTLYHGTVPLTVEKLNNSILKATP